MSSQGTKNQRQEQAAATRQKLLTSAQHLFAQNGYKGTTVRMINRSVDLADGLLYHYFPGGKKEIFKEVITGNMQEMFQELQEPEKQDVYEKLPLDAALEAGEVKEMDFEMAALSVNSILMHYVMKRVTDTGHSTLDDKAWRKRLVDYQVSVWSVEKQPENEKEQE